MHKPIENKIIAIVNAISILFNCTAKRLHRCTRLKITVQYANNIIYIIYNLFNGLRIPIVGFLCY